MNVYTGTPLSRLLAKKDSRIAELEAKCRQLDEDKIHMAANVLEVGMENQQLRQALLWDDQDRPHCPNCGDLLAVTKTLEEVHSSVSPESVQRAASRDE